MYYGGTLNAGAGLSVGMVGGLVIISFLFGVCTWFTSYSF